MSAKLTEARREALSNVATGEVRQSWPVGPGRPRWLMGTAWQPLRPQPYEWLRNQGLIRVEPSGFGTHQSRVFITDAGREVLGVRS